MTELMRVAKRLPFPLSAHGSSNCARMCAFKFVEQAVVNVTPSLRRLPVLLDPTSNDPSRVSLDCLHLLQFSVSKEILCVRDYTLEATSELRTSELNLIGEKTSKMYWVVFKGVEEADGNALEGVGAERIADLLALELVSVRRRLNAKARLVLHCHGL